MGVSWTTLRYLGTSIGHLLDGPEMHWPRASAFWPFPFTCLAAGRSTSGNGRILFAWGANMG